MARKRKDVCLHSDRSNGLRDKPIQRNAANARERARMRVLSKAFSRLKTTLPWVPADTKLSKLDTLRLAASYIAHLRQILLDESNEGQMIHPINLTWPFTFNAARAQDEDNAATSTTTMITNSDHHHHHNHHTSVSSDCPFTQELMDYDYSNGLHVP